MRTDAIRLNPRLGDMLERPVGGAADPRRAKYGLAAVLLVAYVVVAAFPIGDSGSIQASHMVAGLVVLLVLVARWQRPDLDVWILPFAAFCVYSSCVALVWAAILGSLEPLILSLPLLLGVALLWVIPLIARDYPRILVHGLYAASVGIGIVLTGLVFTTGLSLTGASNRSALLFANPNQLAYFGVLTGSIAVACAYIGNRGRILAIVGVVSASVPVLVSQSRGGFAAMLVLLGLAALFPRQGRAWVIAVVASLLYVILDTFNFGLTDVMANLPWIAMQSDDTFAARGYDRLWRFSQFLVFGAGEGVNHRFAGQFDVELHSTIFNVLFSYGIVGSTLLGVGVARIVRTGGKWFVFMLPALVYGMTHNGIRQPLLWILMGLSLMAPTLHVALRLTRLTTMRGLGVGTDQRIPK